MGTLACKRVRGHPRVEKRRELTRPRANAPNVWNYILSVITRTANREAQCERYGF